MSFEPVRNREDFWSNELIIPRSARNTFLSCLSNGLFPQQDGDWSNKISMCMRMIRNHKKFQDDNHKTQESTKKMGSSALGIVMFHPFSSAICFQVIPTWQFLAKWGTGPVFALPGGPDLCPSPVIGSRWPWSNGQGDDVFQATSSYANWDLESERKDPTPVIQDIINPTTWCFWD